MGVSESTLNFEENKVRKVRLVTFLFRRSVTRNFENVLFFFVNYGTFSKLPGSERVNTTPMKISFLQNVIYISLNTCEK